MKPHIRAECSTGVAAGYGICVMRLDGFKVGENLGPNGQGDVLGSQRLQRLAHEINLRDLCRIKNAHDRALVGNALDQADAFELGQRFADHMALHIMPCRQLFLD